MCVEVLGGCEVQRLSYFGVCVCFCFCKETVDMFEVCVVLFDDVADSVVCDGVEDYGLSEGFVSGCFCVKG